MLEKTLLLKTAELRRTLLLILEYLLEHREQKDKKENRVHRAARVQQDLQ